MRLRWFIIAFIFDFRYFLKKLIFPWFFQCFRGPRRVLEASREGLGGVLGRFGGVLEGSWVVLEVSWHVLVACYVVAV